MSNLHKMLVKVGAANPDLRPHIQTILDATTTTPPPPMGKSAALAPTKLLLDLTGTQAFQDATNISHLVKNLADAYKDAVKAQIAYEYSLPCLERY